MKKETLLEKRLRNIRLTLEADRMAIESNDRILSIFTFSIVLISGLLVVTL